MIEQFWLYHCAWMRVPASALIAGARHIELLRLPMMGAIAHHRELGPILVDAPFGHEGPANAGGLLALILRGTGMRFREEWSVVCRLEELGYRAADVHHIVMTHLHSDHTGGMKELGHATFHLFRDEWEHALSLSPARGLSRGYVVSDFRALHARMQFQAAPEPTPDGEPVWIDLFGDGSVEMVHLPGHGAGHAGYRFTLTDGRRIFHVGDAVYSLLQITDDRDLGPFGRNAAFDLARARQTMQWLRDYHRRNPDDLLVCAHDSTLGDRCLNRPLPLHEV